MEEQHDDLVDLVEFVHRAGVPFSPDVARSRLGTNFQNRLV
jgi:hypothetical protein